MPARVPASSEGTMVVLSGTPDAAGTFWVQVRVGPKIEAGAGLGSTRNYLWTVTGAAKSH